MPNKVNDPQGNCKKRHIGNDYVTIVYNNSDEEFDISTIKVPTLPSLIINMIYKTRFLSVFRRNFFTLG